MPALLIETTSGALLLENARKNNYDYVHQYYYNNYKMHFSNLIGTIDF